MMTKEQLKDLRSAAAYAVDWPFVAVQITPGQVVELIDRVMSAEAKTELSGNPGELPPGYDVWAGEADYGYWWECKNKTSHTPKTREQAIADAWRHYRETMR
jgi:hypothetical protein